MKKVNVKSYTKRDLMIFCSLVLLFGLGALIGGIVLVINGCSSYDTIAIIWKVIVGIVVALLGAVAFVVGVIMTIVARSTIDTDGSVKLDNPVKGTKNMNKCPHCHKEISEDSEFCNHCGKKIDETVDCKCGEKNPSGSEFCQKCGAKLKK